MTLNLKWLSTKGASLGQQSAQMIRNTSEFAEIKQEVNALKSNVSATSIGRNTNSFFNRGNNQNNSNSNLQTQNTSNANNNNINAGNNINTNKNSDQNKNTDYYGSGNAKATGKVQQSGGNNIDWLTANPSATIPTATPGGNVDFIESDPSGYTVYDPSSGKYYNHDNLTGITYQTRPLPTQTVNEIMVGANLLLAATGVGELIDVGLDLVYVGSTSARALGSFGLFSSLNTAVTNSIENSLGQYANYMADFSSISESVNVVTPLYRAVKSEELSDIYNSGQFFNPDGLPSKYFSFSNEGASFYAQQSYTAFSDGPFTIVKSNIPTDMITPSMAVLVDRGIPSVVIPTDILTELSEPEVLNYTPINLNNISNGYQFNR